MRWADVTMLRTVTLCLVGCWRVASGGDSADIVPDGQFETLSYAQIVQEIQDLATDYPQLAQVLVQTKAICWKPVARCCITLENSSMMCQMGMQEHGVLCGPLFGRLLLCSPFFY